MFNPYFPSPHTGRATVVGHLADARAAVTKAVVATHMTLVSGPAQPALDVLAALDKALHYYGPADLDKPDLLSPEAAVKAASALLCTLGATDIRVVARDEHQNPTLTAKYTSADGRAIEREIRLDNARRGILGGLLPPPPPPAPKPEGPRWIAFGHTPFGSIQGTVCKGPLGDTVLQVCSHAGPPTLGQALGSTKAKSKTKGGPAPLRQTWVRYGTRRTPEDDWTFEPWTCVPGTEEEARNRLAGLFPSA